MLAYLLAFPRAIPNRMVMQAPATIFLMLAALGPLGAALAATMAPPPSGPVAAVFPPWWDGRMAVTAAASAGAVVRQGAFASVVIVSATDRARLRSHGALFLLDPGAFGGCSPAAH
jgi:hypothetical protein